MIKAGTLCYVIGEKHECAQGAEVVLGTIVTVRCRYTPRNPRGYHCDEIYRIDCCVGELKACRHSLRPISDPSADVTERADEKEPVAA